MKGSAVITKSFPVWLPVAAACLIALGAVAVVKPCLRLDQPTAAASERSLKRDGVMAAQRAVLRGSARNVAKTQPAASASNWALQAMPLSFIENHGQADARAAFIVQGRNTSAYFTAQGLTLALTQPSPQYANNPSPTAASNGQSRLNRWNLKLDFVGADPAARPVGKNLTPASVSYFSGPPQSWRMGELFRVFRLDGECNAFVDVSQRQGTSKGRQI